MIYKLFKSTHLFLFLLLNFQLISCVKQDKSSIIKDEKTDVIEKKEIITAANRTELYINQLRGKKVGIVANQTSVIFKNSTDKILGIKHLVDSLLSLKIDVKKVFSPEHGFRGKADAGAHVDDGVDTKTGLPILSLHGKNKKPTQEQLQDLDVVVFDIDYVNNNPHHYYIV